MIYSHQDIRLPKEDMLSQFVEYVRQVGPDDIVGVAGVAEVESPVAGVVGDWAGTCVLSYILHGKTVPVRENGSFVRSRHVIRSMNVFSGDGQARFS